MTKTILILGISTVLASIACSAETTGSGDSNITSGDTKQKTDTKGGDKNPKPATSASTKPGPGPAPSSTSPSTSPFDTCMGACLGANAKAKKLREDSRACMSKCPADPGGPMTESSGASGGGGGSSDKEAPVADAPSDACWNACDKAFNDVCDADKPTCDALVACEDKCEPPGESSGSSSSSQGKDDTETKPNE